MNSMSRNQKIVIGVLAAFVIIALCVLGVLVGRSLFGAGSPSSPDASTATSELTATFTLPPTATQPPEALDPVWERIQSTGKLVVGMSADYPPYAYINDAFQLTGYDLALIQEIGKRLGLTLDIQNMAFDGLLNAVQINQIDVAVAAISVTTERDQVVDFSNVYFVSEDALLAEENSTIQINRIEDLAQYRVGVQRGTTYETLLYDMLVEPGLMPPQLLVRFDTPEQAVEALFGNNPQVSVVMLDVLPAEVAARALPVKMIARGLNPQRMAIALPNGAMILQSKLNEVIQAMQNDGTLTALAKQYLNVDNLIPLPTPGPTQPPATPEACLDGMLFIGDLNYPDNGMTSPPQFQPGVSFQKGWRIRNTGTCTWDSSYVLTYVGSAPPNTPVGGNPVAIQGRVAPGQEYDIYVTLTAPLQPGRYQSFWNLRSSSGLYFGTQLYAGFDVVGQATSTPQPERPAIYLFTVDRTIIQEGQCVNLSWRFGGQGLVLTRIFRNDQIILRDMPFVGEFTDCPPGAGDFEYRLVVDSEFGGSARAVQYVRAIPQAQPTPTLAPTAEQPPIIDLFSVQPSVINLGDCADITWEFHGSSIALAQISRNGEVIVEDPPPSGQFQDCPPAAGQIEYLLKVDSEFSGSAQQSVFIQVENPGASAGSQLDVATTQINRFGLIGLPVVIKLLVFLTYSWV